MEPSRFVLDDAPQGGRVPPVGWNACSSSLSPLTGHAFLERRYLIIPGLRSSRMYIVDTKPDPTKAKICKIIEPEEFFKKTGYSRPHTVHCGPEGIYVSTLGYHAHRRTLNRCLSHRVFGPMMCRQSSDDDDPLIFFRPQAAARSIAPVETALRSCAAGLNAYAYS
jgi:56kDa selenium binding protein (SBP56)